jgi:ATP synthase protein I
VGNGQRAGRGRERQARQSKAELWQTVGLLSSAGLSFVLAVIIGAGFGLLLDSWLGTRFVFFLIFFFLGLAAGILNVFRISSRYLRR